jgi:segregation and condensation protein B
MPAHPLARPGLLCRDRLPPLRRATRPLGYRFWAQQPEVAAGAGELARHPKVAWLEAALLAADEPLAPRRLAALAGLADAAEARRLVAGLRDLYEKGGSAFQVEEVAGGYQLLTRAEFHPWLARVRRSAGVELSPAARETLTIIAYRQPVTRADVEAIRGVGSGEVLRQLMEKKLVRVAGRDDSLGRPTLYATTRTFLQLFGLRSLKELPPAEGVAPPEERKPGGEAGGE